jgi:hypothetical protein
MTDWGFSRMPSSADWGRRVVLGDWRFEPRSHLQPRRKICQRFAVEGVPSFEFALTSVTARSEHAAGTRAGLSTG